MVKSRLSAAAVPVLVGCLLSGWAHSAHAQCVSCGPGGECFNASDGFSANCECRIRNIHGAVICTPHGACDPNVTNSCDDGPPQLLTAKDPISTQFVRALAEKNPLLAGAVWGGITEENSASRKTLHVGSAAREYTGTMGQDGKSYSFRTRVQLLADHSYSLAVHVEEDGTSHAEDYEGVIQGGGLSGSLEHVGPQGRTSVFSWK
jgi:hypothetical protein